MSELASGFIPEIETQPEPEKQERVVKTIARAEINLPGVEDMPRAGDTYIVADRDNKSHYNADVIPPTVNPAKRPENAFYVSSFRDSNGEKLSHEEAMSLYEKQDTMPAMSIIAIPIVDSNDSRRKEMYIGQFLAAEAAKGELL